MIKILIVEDELPVRNSIKELLEINNYRVFSASDGVEGIQLAKEIHPDLILCDILMPKLDGIEVFRNLKKEKEFILTPFIFLTAKAEISDIREGMELGADDYIIKPFRAAGLLKAIETRLAKAKVLKQTNINKEPSKKKEILNEDDRIFIKVKNKPQIIKVGDILCIKANGEYSTVYLLSGSKILLRKLIKQWEDQLPGKIFLRIHRSTIINVNYIEKIEQWFNRSYIIFLKNCDEKFVISQRYSSKIKSTLMV